MIIGFYGSQQSARKTNSMEHTASWEANSYWPSQEIPAFYGTRMFCTEATTTRRLSISLAKSTHSAPPNIFLYDQF